jgi:acetolactate synthase I/III small subunit
VVLEATGSPGKLDALLAMLEHYGVCELVRTGRVAMARGADTITDRSLAAVPAAAAQAS